MLEGSVFLENCHKVPFFAETACRPRDPEVREFPVGVGPDLSWNHEIPVPSECLNSGSLRFPMFQQF